MANVEIYTKQLCPYCVAAKRLLDDKGVVYREVSVDFDPAQLQAMMDRSGRQTVPQIFIDGNHVGGCDDLVEEDAIGALDRRLGNEVRA